MKKKRTFTTLNLSFLDVMSCGLGAAVLIFLLLRHSIDAPTKVVNKKVLAEISLLEEEVKQGEESLVRIRNTISDISKEDVIAQGRAKEIQEKIDELLSQAEDADASKTDISTLKKRLATLQAQKTRLESENIGASKALEFTGEGQRQYLTGLKLGGDNVLILVDMSASMLDESIVNIIRRRNMSTAVKRQSPKWQKTIAITRWIAANLPLQSDYQVLAFNDSVQNVGDDTGVWQEVSNTGSLDKVMRALQKIEPKNGTNLSLALREAMQIKPLPDNIFIITDGLPTLENENVRKSTVSGKQRLRLFYKAINEIEQQIPVNTILLPLEGDPYAAAAFWQLAIKTRGAFITPASDWP